MVSTAENNTKRHISKQQNIQKTLNNISSTGRKDLGKLSVQTYKILLQFLGIPYRDRPTICFHLGTIFHGVPSVYFRFYIATNPKF